MTSTERPQRERLLIVDDEPNMRLVLKGLLSREGYQVETANDGLSALRWLKEHGGQVSAILTDLRMPQMDGMALLAKVTELYPGRPVVLLTAHGTVDTAVEAMKVGAFDFVTKPFDATELRSVIRKAVNTAKTDADAPEADQEGSKHGRYGMIGNSEPMQEVYQVLDKVADTPTTVLITGESGTGKELVAEALHYHSSKKDAPFIRVNCAAIPEQLLESELFGYEEGAFSGAVTSKPGRFELANGGTLFIDEITEIPDAVQVKLLNAIQESSFEPIGGVRQVNFNVRLVVATKRKLQEEVEAGRFREDLFYRLNVAHVHVPPLRKRQEDILPLINFLIERYNKRLGKTVKGLSEDALQAFYSYDWPGNVREMENVLERLVLFSEHELIHLDLLPDELKEPRRDEGEEDANTRLDRDLSGRISMKDLVRETTAQLEKELIIQALEQTQGNVTRSSQLLMISRKSLQNKMKEFSLREED